jgi:RHS repeat-associated protein
VTYRTSGGTKTKAVQYVYDVNDRRIEKRLDATGDGVYESKERYIYDGQDIVLVYDQNNSLLARYLHGPGEDQPLAEEVAGVTKWPLADEQGSIRDVQDNTGNLVSGSHVIYNSFGLVTSGTAGRYAYTGREWDGDAGLFYYRARWYDAGVGRFISQDPIGFEGGDANLYRYVGNNAPNLEDRSGLAASNSGSSSWGRAVDWVTSGLSNMPSAEGRSASRRRPASASDGLRLVGS